MHNELKKKMKKGCIKFCGLQIKKLEGSFRAKYSGKESLINTLRFFFFEQIGNEQSKSRVKK